jgi:hypothetical protein
MGSTPLDTKADDPRALPALLWDRGDRVGGVPGPAATLAVAHTFAAPGRRRGARRDGAALAPPTASVRPVLHEPLGRSGAPPAIACGCFPAVLQGVAAVESGFARLLLFPDRGENRVR